VLRNDQIQAAIVSYLKGKSDVTSLLANGAEEIREDQWQGREFKYPNVRVRLIENEPEEPNCDLHRVIFSCLVFSEDASSQQADTIAGIINNTLHGKSFSSNSISFSTRTTSLVPAIRSDERTWRAETILEARASG
jgi:hypothetical protein